MIFIEMNLLPSCVIVGIVQVLSQNPSSLAGGSLDQQAPVKCGIVCKLKGYKSSLRELICQFVVVLCFWCNIHIYIVHSVRTSFII